uniref:SHSP domain-containing protein n=1 Tax=Mycena chlorophos TaxID=658473 RepID=A0ABQ0MAP9_MYCCL|nr:predicted protein [Mycena chlorophos]
MLHFSPTFDLDRVNEAFRTHADAFNSLIEGVGSATGATGKAAQVATAISMAASAFPVQPRMQVHETQAGVLTASFELPGIARDDVRIDAFAKYLRVSANSGPERKPFSTTLYLPAGVTNEHIRASMRNGVLSVTYPKSVPDVPRRIEVE